MNCHHCQKPATRKFVFVVLPKDMPIAHGLPTHMTEIHCCDKNDCMSAAGASTQKTLLEKYPGEKSKLSGEHAN